MSNRSRLVLGSLGGAFVIHVAALACSGNSVLGGRPGADASVADGGAAPSRDGGLADAFAGLLDAIGGAVHDVATTVVDGEVRDAHAGGDAGTGCTCTQPAFDASFSLTYDVGGGTLRPRGEYSTGGAGVNHILLDNQPVMQLLGSATFYDDSGNRLSLTCSTVVRPDWTPLPGRYHQCNLSMTARDNTSYSSEPQTAVVTIATLTDTRIELRVSSVSGFSLRPSGGSDAGVRPISFSNVVFRSSGDAYHYLAIPNAYRP